MKRHIVAFALAYAATLAVLLLLYAFQDRRNQHGTAILTQRLTIPGSNVLSQGEDSNGLPFSWLEFSAGKTISTKIRQQLPTPPFFQIKQEGNHLTLEIWDRGFPIHGKELTERLLREFPIIRSTFISELTSHGLQAEPVGEVTVEDDSSRDFRAIWVTTPLTALIFLPGFATALFFFGKSMGSKTTLDSSASRVDDRVSFWTSTSKIREQPTTFFAGFVIAVIITSTIAYLLKSRGGDTLDEEPHSAQEDFVRSAANLSDAERTVFNAMLEKSMREGLYPTLTNRLGAFRALSALYESGTTDLESREIALRIIENLVSTLDSVASDRDLGYRLAPQIADARREIAAFLERHPELGAKLEQNVSEQQMTPAPDEAVERTNP